MSLTIELPTQEEQTAFNLQRWAEVLQDEEAARWTGRVETDRFGYLLMSPPPSFSHSRNAKKIVSLLERALPHGEAYHEVPISTPDGVRAADAIWISDELLEEIGQDACLRCAPQICVEIISPGNTARELNEKKALYFAAGAVEVWFCDGRGEMTFFKSADSAGERTSAFCPTFPEKL